MSRAYASDGTRLAQLHLAESALSAPAAAFGGVEFYVLLGSDYPFNLGELHPLDSLAKVEGLTPEEVGGIAGGTTAALLGLV